MPVLSHNVPLHFSIPHPFLDYILPPLHSTTAPGALLCCSYDYGIDYLKEQLEGKCGCEADCCFSKRKQTQQAKAAASAAASPAAAAAAAAAANTSP